jgi:hypothetical protein
MEDKADYLFHLILTAPKEEIIPSDRKILENLAADAKHTGLYSLSQFAVAVITVAGSAAWNSSRKNPIA